MLIGLALAVVFVSNANGQIYKPGQVITRGEQKQMMLPNGWRLSPAGRSLALGDLPLNMALSYNKGLLAVTNNGQGTQSIQLIDTKEEKVLDDIEIKTAWYGLKFSRDGRNLYVSGGNDNIIWKYEIRNDKLILSDSIVLGKKWPEKISPAGIDIDDERQLMYVVTKEDNSLYIIDLTAKTVKQKIALTSKAYACLLSADKKELFISSWGDDQLHFFNTTADTISATIQMGDNPNELLLSKDGRYLYIANANDNSVSIVDVPGKRVMEVLNTALFTNSPNGSTTNGLALSPDDKTLYIANADNNYLAVFDVARPGYSKSAGFIPVGWYPTNVKLAENKIFVSNGKGFTSFANPEGPQPVSRDVEVIYQKGEKPEAKKEEYIGSLMKGTLSIIDVPGEEKLKDYTRQVFANTPYTRQKMETALGNSNNPIPMRLKEKSPIKHVFYIVKENRTYDQVLADVETGDGDTSLLLFGKDITPNQHALVNEFVLFDNFYVDAEVSADGHNWSMAAYATDYTEKTWPSHYGGRGGTYDYEGQEKVGWPKKGFIWDHCRSAGISYRTYGEFADDYKPNIPGLQDHFCPYFTSWDQRVRDTTRFSQWKREFDSLLAVNAVPQLNTLRFINDHTEGLSRGRPTPFAHVADNDYAVGLFVEHLSKSPIWKESVVFILEDDAQNGPDHIDAHRSTLYVAGGHVKRNYVDHNMYSTSSVLRTIGLILGMPPMSQYDAAATSLYRSFTQQVNMTPFTAIRPNVNLNDINDKHTASAIKSESFDFSREDRIPDLEFSEVIWKAVRGEHSVMPAPRRSAFVVPVKSGDDDDDD